eukprot:TRINITY_DN5089_c0_g1_i1.p1 TRINITY_DN5089_c0_g1~~TRINITY_DN5089_c0_g1_i1.p1  ORF type:complete len:528 (-),score=144.65 TRINITY_DN5089_c0_g1_i1:34-1617(-)
MASLMSEDVHNMMVIMGLLMLLLWALRLAVAFRDLQVLKMAVLTNRILKLEPRKLMRGLRHLRATVEEFTRVISIAGEQHEVQQISMPQIKLNSFVLEDTVSVSFQEDSKLVKVELQLLADEALVVDVYLGVHKKAWNQLVEAEVPADQSGSRNGAGGVGNGPAHHVVEEQHEVQQISMPQIKLNSFVLEDTVSVSFQEDSKLVKVELQLLADEALVVDVYLGVHKKAWNQLVEAEVPADQSGSRNGAGGVGNGPAHHVVEEQSISQNSTRQLIKDVIHSPKVIFESMSPNAARLLREEQNDEIVLDTFTIVRNPGSLFLASCVSHHTQHVAKGETQKTVTLEFPVSELSSLAGKQGDRHFACIQIRTTAGLESKETYEEFAESTEVLILKPSIPLPFLSQDENLTKNLEIFCSKVSVSHHCVVGHGAVWEINDIFGIESKNKHHNNQQKRRLSTHSMEIQDDCSICLTEVKNVILLPCRHCCVCHLCFEKIDKCPVCRSQFTSFIRYEKDIHPSGNLTNPETINAH